MTVDTLQRFRRGDLPADDILAVSGHLAGCPGCASLSREQTDSDSVVAALRTLLAETPSDHPDVGTILTSYVDETLSSELRMLVDAHLEECVICHEDVADLREERRGMEARRPNRTVSWLIAAGVAGVALSGAWLWMTQRNDAHVRPHRVPVTIVRTTPPATPAGYGRSDWDRLVGDARGESFAAMPAALRALQVEPDVLRGTSTASYPVAFAPASVIVESTRPELRWPAVQGARYVVAIFRNDEEVARSAPLTTPSWTPTRPLARGATYEWQVEVRRRDDTTTVPAPPDPPAMFAVLDANAAAAIDEARRRFPNDHFLAGLLYARAGVRENATRELESWIAAHPDDRRAAGILLAIRRW